MHSIEFLFRIRIALHLSANKKQDRLIFEYVPDVAKKLRLTQRRLLEKTFAAMLNIEITCGYLIEKITFPLLDKTINEIEMKTLNEFLDNFLQKNKNHSFDITYIYRLQKATKSNISKEILKELFYKDKLFDFFMALYKSKQLGKLFEPIKKITHLPQFDGYHKYPVDIHSIRTLQALENIDDVNVKKLFDSFDKQEKAFIKIVALLHDCGKGRKKDHSQLGAVIVKAFIKNLEFDTEFEKFAYLLVKHHTLMSNIASREDIYSEKVIFSFISKLGDIKVLKFLFVLTYADIESVYKGAYSSFNAKTLNELFIISLEAFENRKRISEAQKRIKKEKILIKDFYFKSISRTLQKKILSIESNLLFFKYTPNEIVDIALWVNSLKTPYDYKISYKETLVIELIRRDNLNLGFLLGKLSNFNVSSMDIFKIYNNIKYFRVEFLENITQDETTFIEKIIKNSFDMDKKIELPCVKMSKSEIDIKCSHSKTYARMSLMTKDSPALLANIMSIFDDIGIDIASAKIQTIKNRARNLFLIEKNGKFCNNQEEVVNRLTKKIEN
jgi:[protein-PII] uridylyltransferase